MKIENKCIEINLDEINALLVKHFQITNPCKGIS